MFLLTVKKSSTPVVGSAGTVAAPGGYTLFVGEAGVAIDSVTVGLRTDRVAVLSLWFPMHVWSALQCRYRLVGRATRPEGRALRTLLDCRLHAGCAYRYRRYSPRTPTIAQMCFILFDTRARQHTEKQLTTPREERKRVKNTLIKTCGAEATLLFQSADGGLHEFS